MPDHCNKRRSVWGQTGEDLLGVLEKPVYSRSATEHRLAGDRCGRVQMNVDIVGSRRNGPQLSTRLDDDDDDSVQQSVANASDVRLFANV